jgi:hypothetical protein
LIKKHKQQAPLIEKSEVFKGTPLNKAGNIEMGANNSKDTNKKMQAQIK